MPIKDFKKYLPSQKFTNSILTIFLVVGAGFIIKEAFSLIKNLINKDGNSGGRVSAITVADIAQEDSNKNGIPDWEEYLWGLDPTKNGSENKAFILAKKKSLVESGDMAQEKSPDQISDNDALSRQLLATIISLSSSDQINNESMESISEAIGQQIAVEEIPNKYTQKDLQIVADTEDSVADYAANVLSLVVAYEKYDLGKEMILISQGIANQDAIPMISARTIANSYRDLSEAMLLMEVPSTFYEAHLSLINNYQRLASAIDGLSKSITDPLVGLKSIVVYNKINKDLNSDMEKLLKFFYVR